MRKLFLLFGVFLTVSNSVFSQEGKRTDLLLDKGWRTVVNDTDQQAYNGFESAGFQDKEWLPVNVPHNWDQYEGYRRLRHGNRHGYAWYRKTFTVDPYVVSTAKGKRQYFLFFEGVGSYATVYLNGKKIGYHAGGRTTFTIDVTNVIYRDKRPNLLAVRAGHPAGIKDLPWVCGGCSEERGFSEGSQPLGIFRPVHLIVTDPVRIEPFGVHIWNDTTVSEKSALLHAETTIKNYGTKSSRIKLISRVMDNKGKTVVSAATSRDIKPGGTLVIGQSLPALLHPTLWSLENPYLYTVVSEVVKDGQVVDREETPYGIRWISWPLSRGKNTGQFLLNGRPVFINGIGEYEHAIGHSHAFTAEQIKTRAMQIRAAGFNAFRDAHQPHNLRYQEYWDKLGVLCWTQLSAHIWYDTKAFRDNFKTLLTDWIKERRNSPSVILWGLQNESRLPDDFARECTELIRKLDPTASAQRLVTSCNGGGGTDWDVPQNWTGTYGGNPATYAEDLKRQVLVGEYGAWRTIDLHTEGPFLQNGAYSEDRMTQLMEMKVRLAESVKDSVAGHFFWLFNSHDNPGRVQSGEGLKPLDQIGPVNYKGLLTSWEEPLDVYYMYRANYVPATKEPMVYIVSHTWPGRWTSPGKKDGIVVYSNCEEVELFNDVNGISDMNGNSDVNGTSDANGTSDVNRISDANGISLGKRKRQGIGTHFQWDDVMVQYNVLYAVGYVKGKPVAKDYIVLDHLPGAPHFDRLYDNSSPVTAARPGYHYIYRVNCGGAEYRDSKGNTWLADHDKTTDTTWGSVSWAADFPGVPPFFASVRRTYDPIKGTKDWPLFQTFRYGREKLSYEFPVPDGEYLLELYFTEPWYGTGGGMDCTGWRLFDVAVNDTTVIRNLDIWKEAGHDGALKKTVKVKVTGGTLRLSFPKIASGQAVISAIAIATTDPTVRPAPASPGEMEEVYTLVPAYDQRRSFTFKNVLRIDGSTQACPIEVGVADNYSFTVRYASPAPGSYRGWLELRAADGALLKKEPVEFDQSRPGKVNYLSSTTDGMINAGTYQVRIITPPRADIKLAAVEVQ